MRKRKHNYMPVAAGFIIIYLAVMTGATCLVHNKYMEEYEMRYENKMQELNNQLSSDDACRIDTAYQKEYRQYEILRAFTVLYNINEDKYQKFSAAFYDYTINELKKTQDSFSINLTDLGFMEKKDTYTLIDAALSDYLSEEDMIKMAEIVEEDYAAMKADMAVPDESTTYNYYAAIDKNTQTLYRLLIERIAWEKQDYPDFVSEAVPNPYLGGYYHHEITDKSGQRYSYAPIEFETVWSWENPDYFSSDDSDNEYHNFTVLMPYNMGQGRQAWMEWHKNFYLQSTIRNLDQSTMEKMYEDSINQISNSEFTVQYSDIRIISTSSNNKRGILLLASECHPWMAAVNYMKYVYLSCLILMLACMSAVICILHKTNKERAAIEENRRDFTNALAHEMKTPLGVIRGFSENLMENTVPEKKDYYLNQIVKGTEEIAHLADEMRDLSKLDSEPLDLQQRKLSVADIIKDELCKLEPLIAEQQLTIQLQEEALFQVEADRKYLSKAIFNLLDNAVSYSHTGSIIDIRIKERQCIIENTCQPIEKEKLDHLFDAFCQANPNGYNRGSHYGMGLYLTKKILNLFNMSIEIGNTENGVKVTFRL
ncbi:MAG: sensor histidine kinase [Coprococcus sp.]